MSEQKKTHKISLDNGHSEEVTESELKALQARYPRNFPYTVEPLQVAKPTDLPAPKVEKAENPKDGPKPA